MENIFARAARFLREQRLQKRWRKIISVLAAAVVFCTTYALILPALTAERQTVCGMEEHVHTDECFENGVQVCGKEEHTHVDECFPKGKGITIGIIRQPADTDTSGEPDIDVQNVSGQEVADGQPAAKAKTREQLMQELEALVKTGNRAEDVVAAAKSFIGYEEDGRGFVSEVLAYAGIEGLPEVTDEQGGYVGYADWAKAVREAGLYADVSSVPKEGDLVFLDWEANPEVLGHEDERIDHAGIVINVRTKKETTETGETKKSVRDIMVLTSNTNGRIESFFYNMEDPANINMIAGYAKLPENPEQNVTESAGDSQTASADGAQNTEISAADDAGGPDGGESAAQVSTEDDTEMPSNDSGEVESSVPETAEPETAAAAVTETDAEKSTEDDKIMSSNDDNKSETTPETEELTSETAAESETDAAAENSAETESMTEESELAAEAGAETGTEQSSETGTETEIGTEQLTETGAETEIGTELTSEEETGTETELSAEEGTETGTELSSETETETDTELTSETDTEVETEPSSENDTELTSETGAEAESETDWTWEEETESETGDWTWEDEEESETDGWDWTWEDGTEDETDDWDWTWEDETESETSDWTWEDEAEDETGDWTWEDGTEDETDDWGWTWEDETEGETDDWGWTWEDETEEDGKIVEEETEPETEEIPEVSDPSEDLETNEDWEASVADVELTGVWADDLTAVAKTQLGVKESVKNFETDEDGTRRGITRYGQWYGEPYGDDWSAMFVSFCLNYAEVPHESVPRSGKCGTFIEMLQVYGLYENPEEYEPTKGDLVFLDTDLDGTADHAGITEEVTEIGIGGINVIAGDLDGKVKNIAYAKDDKAVVGYGRLPQKPAKKLLHKIYKGDDVIITAEYTAEAMIPDEAQLVAEEIPEDNERYAQHLQTVQAMMEAGLKLNKPEGEETGEEEETGTDTTADEKTSSEDMVVPEASENGDAATAAYNIEETVSETGENGAKESASGNSETADIGLTEEQTEGETEEKELGMRVYNIGFYLDEYEEIEPQAEVKISIEFLDDLELANGASTVIHMADEGPEALDVTNTEDEEDGKRKIEFATKTFSLFFVVAND